MKNNKKRILCGILSAFMSVSALTVTTSTVSVFAESSADHNDMVSVDFETTPDSKLLDSKYITTDPDDSKNHVMKFENPKDNADNVIVGITPKDVLTNVPADNKTGVLTYEFDIKFPEDNPMENKNNGWYYPIYTRMAAFDGPITSILRTTSALPQSEVQTEKVDITGTKYTWYNVKQVFDYITKEFKVYVQGKQLGGAVSFAADLESGKDPIKALYFRAWAQGKFKWFIDNLKISYVEQQPQLVTGLSVYDGENYISIDGFDYASDTYNAQVYGDIYGQFDTVKNPVKVNLASGYEDAAVSAAVGAEVNGVKTMVVTVSKWPYTCYYTINCTAKPRPYYNGGISENFNGKTRDTVASFITLPGKAEIVNDGGGHGDVVKTTSANSDNYFLNFNGASLKDVCDADGRIIYEFDYKVDDKYKALSGGQSTPIAVKLSGNTFVYLRWDNIRCDSLNLTQSVITTGNPDDYDWIHMKFVVDTATKKIDIYVNDELFCSPSVSSLTKEQLFSGQLHWWSGSVNQSVVYIDNFSISYVASHPDMVSEIKLLDESFPGFEQKVYEYDVNVYEDLYKDLSPEDLDVVLNSQFDSKTTVTKTMEQVGSEKVITVTLESDPWKCSYKFNCKSVMRPAVLAIDECELEGYDITYKGRINNNLDEAIQRNMTVLVYQTGQQVLGSGTKHIGIISSDVYGQVLGEISLYDDEASAKLYPLTVVFNPYGVDEPIKKEFIYANNVQLEESIAAVKQSDKKAVEYILSEDTSKGISKEYNMEIFRKMRVWSDKLDELSGKSDNVSEKIIEIATDMTESEKTEFTKENVGKIVNGALITAYLNEGSVTKNVLCELLKEYDNNVEAINVNSLDFADLNETGKLNVAQNLINNKPSGGFKTRKDMVDTLNKALLLEGVNTEVYTKLEKLLTDNEAIIGEGKLVKLKAENDIRVKDYAMREIVKTAAKSPIKSIDELIKILNSKLEEGEKEYPDKNTSSGSSGGSGGGGGGGTSGKPVSIGQSPYDFGTEDNNQSDNNGTSDISGFTDMVGFEWASEAVHALVEAGIVSGVGDNSFEPRRTITREEFVKLICVAFGIETDGSDNGFEDVPADSWYGAYVSAAVEAGIVSGVSDNMFGTGQNITRQDMAVMIHRATEILGKTAESGNGQITFVDSDKVSDYASEAVSQLAGLKIINGVGDNMFAPADFATRAEAAVIIYRCLQTFK